MIASRALLRVAALLLLLAPALAHGEEARTAPPVDQTPTVLIIDASGSMAAAMDGRTRLDAARKAILDDLAGWSAARPLALVAYGHRRAGDCRDIETLRPMGTIDLPAIAKDLQRLRARGKTPLSASLRHAAKLLPPGGGTILLVSDGLETCSEDPCTVARDLRAANAAVTIHVIGFGVSETERAALACIADNGGGTIAAAGDGAALSRAIDAVASAPPPPPPPATPAPAPAPPAAPAPPPPPSPRPVQFVATIGGEESPLAVGWTIRPASGGDPLYEGTARSVDVSLLPGAYAVTLAAANTQTTTRVTVPDRPAPRLEVPIEAGLLTLSLVAAKGLAIEDADLKGSIAWTLAPLGKEKPATLDPVLAPAALLAPGRYRVTGAIGGFTAAAEVTVKAGRTTETALSLKLGRLAPAARLTAEGPAIESGTALSWSLVAEDGATVAEAKAVARPVLLAPAGALTLRLSLPGATIERPVTVREGETTDEVVTLPTGTITLQAALAAGAAPFSDWRDAAWTVKPDPALAALGAVDALTDKAEAMPVVALLPGRWQVAVTSGEARRTTTIDVAPDEARTVVVPLDAARLTVTAAPKPGAPPPLNVVVSVFPESAAEGAAPLFSGGTSREIARVLPAGRYRVEALDEQGRRAAATLALAPGEETVLALTINEP